MITAVGLTLASTGAAATPIRSGFFRLSRVHVDVRGSSLVFGVTLSHVLPDNRPALAWSLAPTGGPACENPGLPGGTRSRNGLVVWDQQGPTFRWDRRSGRCAGTVSVVAENQYEHCTAVVRVTGSGATPAAPACALGGYAIGFSTLPVPAAVFHAYDRIRTQLSAPARNAAAVARQIRDALQAQTGALALFPPLWYCDFQRTFTPIATLSADLGRAASVAAGRDGRAAAQALASCAPAPVRAAFERLAASPKPQASDLVTTLKRYFPTVFGFRFDDLVSQFAAEEAALTEAEAAAAAGNPGAAARPYAAASRSARAISTGLDHYQRRIVRIENAHN